MADGGANALDLVGRDRRTDARAADHDAALRLAGFDLLGQCAGDVRKIDRFVIEGAYIDDLMAERADVLDHRILEGPSGMI
ncbi:hypothetical protein MAE02_55440 [Microvirga aerophila]|uniref:Uncharacterized protein n=1 Tax=Microvirga aerophila TaxID=670291 RepID=A0A512C0W4_9HYPH|nr:hypothetical protein MAE02_55440 [Microvirga aerophila]